MASPACLLGSLKLLDPFLQLGWPSWSSAASAGTIGSSFALGPEWVLEEVSHDGRALLVDRPTGKVYDELAPGLFRPFGSLSNGKVVPLMREPTHLSERSHSGRSAENADLAAAAQAEGPGGAVPWRDVFVDQGWLSRHGKDFAVERLRRAAALSRRPQAQPPSPSSASAASAAGAAAAQQAGLLPEPVIGPDEVIELLKELLPRVDKTDCEYAQLQLDVSGSKPLTLPQLLSFLSECEAAGRVAVSLPETDAQAVRRISTSSEHLQSPKQPPASNRLAAAITRLRAAVQSRGRASIEAEFVRIHRAEPAAETGPSSDSAGGRRVADAAPAVVARVSGRGLLQFLRRAAPVLTQSELRFLLPFLLAWEAISLPEFFRAVGVAPPRVVTPAAGGGVGSGAADELPTSAAPSSMVASASPAAAVADAAPAAAAGQAGPATPGASGEPSAAAAAEGPVPDREYWELNEVESEGKKLLEDRLSGKLFEEAAGEERYVRAVGRRLPDGTLEIAARPGPFADGLLAVVKDDRAIVRAVFESAFYTLTRAWWWTADLLRWSAGYPEEGCGSLSREYAVQVLREVVSLVPGAAPADVDHLELQLDLARDIDWEAGVSWKDFSAFLDEVAEKAHRAAHCGEGDIGTGPAELRRWGDRLLRNPAKLDAAFSAALGSPHAQPPAPHGVGSADGPSLAFTGEELRQFLSSEEVRAVCGGDVVMLAAVLDAWDVSRLGQVTLHDVKVALRALIPLKPRAPPGPPTPPPAAKE